MYAYEKLAFDKGSVREKDRNGFLHVKISPLTRVQVAPYYGREIPGFEELGLQRDKIYYGYRPEEELKKESTINSVNGIPIQLRHHADFADNPAKETRIGATGTEATYKSPFLMNSLHFFDKKAIDLIESDAMKELSLAYRYKPDFKSSGEINGQKYDFTMRDLSGNHLALVEKGRAGREVLVYDENPNSQGGIMDNLALDSMGFDQIKKLVGQLATAVNKLASERPAKVETETEKTETEEEEVVTDKCGGDKKEMTADKCGGKKPAKDTDTVKEEAEVKTEEVKTEKKKPAKAEKKEDSEELAEGEEIVKVEDVKKPVKDKEPEDLEDETEEIETEEKTEETEIEEPAEKPAKKGNQGMRSDLEALKIAGLDSAPAEVKRCFVAAYKGPRYTDKETEDKKQAEKMAADSDDEVKEFYLKLFEAAQDVRPTLGDIKIGAYDSAEAIYQEACKKLNLKCTELSAQDVYNNFKQRKTQKPVVSSVSHEHKISGRLESLLNQ